MRRQSSGSRAAASAGVDGGTGIGGRRQGEGQTQEPAVHRMPQPVAAATN
jgi:hypothetical protein